ncbi:MAG: hypothetical protein COA58_02000 [Bacteroidetes bacterium]|nr:MAG: hypothetical protein COA58_02000 [Bacteroidota bacterium]
MGFGCKTSNKIPNSYDYTPVMLHLTDAKQVDSIGFNLVRSLPEILYPRLLTGDLAIWENSDKRLVVGAQQLIKREKLAISPFVRSNDLFIHEFWRIFKNNFEFGIQGFTFTGKDKYGKVINYGYVDAPDIINLLKTEYIPCNASGSSELTYWDALHSKSYLFNLVQFGSEDLKTDRNKWFEYQKQAIYSPKVNRKFYKAIQKKQIVYKILSPTINSNEENNFFYTALEKYINKNKQTILNASNSDHFSSIMFLPWKVDNITITETWTKYKNIPFQELTSIEFFIDKHAIVLSKNQLEELDVQINLQGLEEYLSEKRFSFLLEKINEQEIPSRQSDKYYQNLLSREWNNIKI